MSHPEVVPRSEPSMPPAHHGWSAVRVPLAELTPCASGWRARAVVYLGDLLPVDVRVELRSALVDPVAAAPIASHEMWSEQSYDNGCFVFETTVPATEAARLGDWFVRVQPAHAPHGPTVSQRAIVREPARADR